MKDTVAGGIRASQGTFSSFYSKQIRVLVAMATYSFHCLTE